MKIRLFLLATLLLVRAQAAPDSAPPVAELDALRGSYQRNLAAIAAARESRTEPARRSYAADLDRLQRGITATGDLDGALQVKAERERFASGKDPTATERKAMPATLAALRGRYEKELEPVLAQLRGLEDQQKREYLAALDNLQRRFTVQNQLDKAMLVRTERDGLVGASAGKATPEPSTPGGPLSPSAVVGSGQLDKGFAERIAAAIRGKKLAYTELSKPKGEGGDEAPPEGALLVGFEFMEEKSQKMPDVRSLRAVYLTAAGIKEGADRGRMDKVTNKVMARPGYAVGGINVYHTNGDGRIRGLQVIFMKMIPGEGRLDRDSSSSYKSLWFGAIPHADKPKLLGGDGRAVIGIHGFHGADCDCIGLMQMAE
jgi:hypothetical protein